MINPRTSGKTDRQIDRDRGRYRHCVVYVSCSYLTKPLLFFCLSADHMHALGSVGCRPFKAKLG